MRGRERYSIKLKSLARVCAPCFAHPVRLAGRFPIRAPTQLCTFPELKLVVCAFARWPGGQQDRQAAPSSVPGGGRGPARPKRLPTVEVPGVRMYMHRRACCAQPQPALACPAATSLWMAHLSIPRKVPPVVLGGRFGQVSRELPLPPGAGHEAGSARSAMDRPPPASTVLHTPPCSASACRPALSTRLLGASLTNGATPAAKRTSDFPIPSLHTTPLSSISSSLLTR